jgi:hypothetical protein
MNIFEMVRKGGLEPPRFYPPDPKSGASANSATFAILDKYRNLFGISYVIPAATTARNRLVAVLVALRAFVLVAFLGTSGSTALLVTRCQM